MRSFYFLEAKEKKITQIQSARTHQVDTTCTRYMLLFVPAEERKVNTSTGRNSFRSTEK